MLAQYMLSSVCLSVTNYLCSVKTAELTELVFGAEASFDLYCAALRVLQK